MKTSWLPLCASMENNLFRLYVKLAEASPEVKEDEATIWQFLDGLAQGVKQGKWLNPAERGGPHHQTAGNMLLFSARHRFPELITRIHAPSGKTAWQLTKEANTNYTLAQGKLMSVVKRAISGAYSVDEFFAEFVLALPWADLDLRDEERGATVLHLLTEHPNLSYEIDRESLLDPIEMVVARGASVIEFDALQRTPISIAASVSLNRDLELVPSHEQKSPVGSSTAADGSAERDKRRKEKMEPSTGTITSSRRVVAHFHRLARSWIALTGDLFWRSLPPSTPPLKNAGLSSLISLGRHMYRFAQLTEHSPKLGWDLSDLLEENRRGQYCLRRFHYWSNHYLSSTLGNFSLLSWQPIMVSYLPYNAEWAIEYARQYDLDEHTLAKQSSSADGVVDDDGDDEIKGDELEQLSKKSAQWLSHVDGGQDAQDDWINTLVSDWSFLLSRSYQIPSSAIPVRKSLSSTDKMVLDAIMRSNVVPFISDLLRRPSVSLLRVGDCRHTSLRLVRQICEISPTTTIQWAMDFGLLSELTLLFYQHTWLLLTKVENCSIDMATHFMHLVCFVMTQLPPSSSNTLLANGLFHFFALILRPSLSTKGTGTSSSSADPFHNIWELTAPPMKYALSPDFVMSVSRCLTLLLMRKEIWQSLSPSHLEEWFPIIANLLRYESASVQHAYLEILNSMVRRLIHCGNSFVMNDILRRLFGGGGELMMQMTRATEMSLSVLGSVPIQNCLDTAQQILRQNVCFNEEDDRRWDALDDAQSGRDICSCFSCKAENVRSSCKAENVHSSCKAENVHSSCKAENVRSSHAAAVQSRCVRRLGRASRQVLAELLRLCLTLAKAHATATEALTYTPRLLQLLLIHAESIYARKKGPQHRHHHHYRHHYHHHHHHRPVAPSEEQELFKILQIFSHITAGPQSHVDAVLKLRPMKFFITVSQDETCSVEQRIESVYAIGNCFVLSSQTQKLIKYDITEHLQNIVMMSSSPQLDLRLGAAVIHMLVDICQFTVSQPPNLYKNYAATLAMDQIFALEHSWQSHHLPKDVVQTLHQHIQEQTIVFKKNFHK